MSWLEGTLLIDVLLLMVNLRGMDMFRQMWGVCLPLCPASAVSGGNEQWGKLVDSALRRDVDCLNTE